MSKVLEFFRRLVKKRYPRAVVKRGRLLRTMFNVADKYGFPITEYALNSDRVYDLVVNTGIRHNIVQHGWVGKHVVVDGVQVDEWTIECNAMHGPT